MAKTIIPEKIYRQVWKIGNNVTNIISLPCVKKVIKVGDGSLVYKVAAEREEQDAVKGDYICEDKWGYWHVVRQPDVTIQNRNNNDILERID